MMLILECVAVITAGGVKQTLAPELRFFSGAPGNIILAALAFALSFVKPRDPARAVLTEAPKETAAGDPAPQREETEGFEAAAPAEGGEQTQD